MNRISKYLISAALLFGATNVFADALSAVPLRVGPVQNYGALGTSGGKIVSLQNNKEVVLRGMSGFWSDAIGIQYYNDEVLTWATNNLGIDVFRFAMGIQYYDSQGGTNGEMDKSYSYMGNPDSYMTTLDLMIESAIKNDIYIIVDWHSHRATSEASKANEFFTKVAQKYGKIPNVIFEVFNEPVNQGWSEITNYASAVTQSIRTFSQNLVLVGTPKWSQLGYHGGVSGTNVGYVFHFYAGTHSVSEFGSRITSAKAAGDAVFITEWGTTTADGKGDANSSRTQEWFTFMENNHISSCNWSLRQKQSDIDNSTEGSAMFDGSVELKTSAALDNATYTNSGKIVKEYLTTHKRSWADTLVAGKNTGSCAFSATTVKEGSGSVSVLKPGCTYASSNEKAVSSTGEVVGAGFAILTGNDQSQSVVVVERLAHQDAGTYFIKDLTCRLDGTCSDSKTAKDLSKTGAKETILSINDLTSQGSPITFTSLNPEIVAVKKATCQNSSYCYGDTYGANVSMYEWKALGDAKILATAPATSGYRALNDTITVHYTKGINRMYSTFKSQTIALGATIANALPDTTLKDHLSVTYTYNDKESTPYLTKVGTSLVAGDKNAIVKITASAPESATYQAMSQTITIIIGDANSAENKADFPEQDAATSIFAHTTKSSLCVKSQGSGIVLQVSNSAPVTISVFDLNGKIAFRTTRNFKAGSNYLPLENLGEGHYMISVKQGSQKATTQWIKK